jgi:uncharacterized protein (DUF1330 family)
MPAYMIALAQVKDRPRFIAEYAIPTAALIETFGGRYLTRTQKVKTLEAGQSRTVPIWTGAVISVWPDTAAIEAFWNSVEYQALKVARKDLAEVQVTCIEDMA